VSTSENIAVLTPTPRPRDRMATAAKPGLRRSQRKAKRTSCIMVGSTPSIHFSWVPIGSNFRRIGAGFRRISEPTERPLK
jgi:hypothetical protein